MTDWKTLRTWGTAEQRVAVDALLEHGNKAAAARSLGISRRAMRSRLDKLKARAVRQGYSPDHDMTHAVPEGYHVKGVSTFYGLDRDKTSPTYGQQVVKGQWVKSRKDDEERLQLLIDAVQDAFTEFRGGAPTVKPPKHSESDLLCVLPMGDPHFGLFSWCQETGVNFDLKTAQAHLFAAVDQLVALAPPAEEALLIDLGDFYHADNAFSRTARSGHVLDTDTRWAKVLRAGIDTFIRCIDRSLEKFQRVKAIIAIGNHDDHSAVMLATALACFYANEPRVTIEESPSKFHYHQFGQNLIGVTHGDTVKLTDLAEVMACDQAKAWGETRHRYWYTGHVHHDSVKDLRGVQVETFRTLAASDNWAHGSGYRSDRDMKCDVMHRRFGRVNRFIVGIEQILEAEPEE